MKDVFDCIKNALNENDVVLFMKGTADLPCCGFSSFVSSLLKKYKIQFKDINILNDNEIRKGIKEFSNWPTIPQLYIRGEFIGGCDIIKEIYQANELEDLFKKHNILFSDSLSQVKQD